MSQKTSEPANGAFVTLNNVCECRRIGAAVPLGSPLFRVGPMDRQTIIDHLELAERHVSAGKLLVEDQRRRVAEHVRKGRSVSVSEALLEQFEKVLEMHIADRDRLLGELRNSNSETFGPT